MKYQGYQILRISFYKSDTGIDLILLIDYLA